MTYIGFSGIKKPEESLIELWKKDYSSSHVFVVPELLEQSLKAFFFENLDQGAFQRRVDEGIAVEESLDDDDRISKTASFLMNRPELFRIVEQITGCGAIGSFQGRIYRFRPGADHGDDWHSDVCPETNRMVGVSVNLSDPNYQGGVFQIREEPHKKICREVHHTSYGAAHFFRISMSLNHRVTSLKGDAARTCLAGWFVSKPKLKDLLAGEA